MLNEVRVQLSESSVVSLLGEDIRFEPVERRGECHAAFAAPVRRACEMSDPRPVAPRRWCPRTPPSGSRWTGATDRGEEIGNCVRCGGR
jgi:hypothetical protein